MRKTVVRAGMILVTSLVILLVGVALAQDYTRADTLVSMGDIWSMIALRSDSLGIFTEVDREDFVEPPYPVPGDTLVSVRGLPGTLDNYFTVFTTETPPGVVVPIEFKHGDSLFTTRVQTRSIPLLLHIVVVPGFILRFLIAASLVAVGLWAFIKRPFSRAVRVLTLFCYALSILMTFAFQSVAPAYASFRLPFEPYVYLIGGLLGWMAAPLWLNLQFVFPREKSWYLRKRLLFDLLCFLPPVSTMLVASGILLDLLPKELSFFAAPPFLQILVTAYFAAGTVLLFRSLAAARDRIEHRMVRLVLWGSLPGLVLMFLVMLAATVFGRLWETVPYVVRLFVIDGLFLVHLLIPFSFATAFGKYRLLEIEGRMRRGTLFVIVNASLLAFLLALVYKAGGWLITITGSQGPAPLLVVSIGVAVGFAPAQRKIRNWLEDRFYPERERLRVLLRDFITLTRDMSDRDEFWLTLEEKLSQGLQTESVMPVLFDARSGNAIEVCRGEPAPFNRGSRLSSRLAQYAHPMLVDEIIASGRLGLDMDQVRWLHAHNAALLLPLIGHGGLLGFVTAGGKTTGEDYTHAEMDILSSLTAQIGVAAENLELLREKVEKEKLEEQLEIARGIQKSLLPLKLPETPGLDAAASITFCLEVAGDFYDMVVLEGGRTMLSLGDVTGKGMGPALLTANLQASLRAITEVGLTLPAVVSRVNRLMFENTPDEFFVTFFTALYDPGSRTLEWVNAGHNAPMLFRTSGAVQKLDEGGLLLGVVHDAAYRSGTTVLRPGDLLFLYTDGVSEAMSPSGEEFGEDRIEALVSAGRNLPLQELIDRLEAEVREHTGSGDFTDDFTIMIVRVKD